MKTKLPKQTSSARRLLSDFVSVFRRVWRKGFWQKLLIVGVVSLSFALSGMYGIARWYIAKHSSEPVQIGATFIPNYARFFDLDPKETLTAMIDDLGLKRFRIVSYWTVGEKSRGTYDFSELDWQFRLAEQKGVKLSLAIGLRQPRWPECHMPEWAKDLPRSEWQPLLMNYIEAVVNRYKDSPALDSYQLENEFFLKPFGICPDYSRDRLVAEYDLVKRLDPDTTLVISMSNNAIGTPIGEPTPDEWAISVYKRVWDKTITNRYFEYPLPAWYYAFRAGWTELTRGHPVFVHELQTEAWLPEGYEMNRVTDVPEQNKSLSAEILDDRIEYGRATGMKKIDLWGVEWWYWRKVKANDPSIWNVGKQEIQRINGKAL